MRIQRHYDLKEVTNAIERDTKTLQSKSRQTISKMEPEKDKTYNKRKTHDKQRDKTHNKRKSPDKQRDKTYNKQKEET
eukprot:GAHX01007145.1.p2 GENE.GAHX01007145.1~~GAHX01007145.1.p2  ORF type:complete len:78 (-),score=25.22 GAHX01007145.1:156-389(-)